MDLAAAPAKEDTAGRPKRVDLSTESTRKLLDRFQRELDASERVAPMHHSYQRIDPYIVELKQAGHTYCLIIYHVESESWYAQQNWFDYSFMYLHDANLIRQGDVIFDLGCNTGCTTCWYAMATGPTGHVHAFDPFPWNAIATRYNAELNGLRNVTVYQTGVGAKHAEIDLSLYDAKITSSHGPHVIKATIQPLSHYANLKPNVLKIDIEGAEYELSQTDFYAFKQLRFCYLELHPLFIEERGLKPETCLANFMRHGFELRIHPNDSSIYDGSSGELTDGGYFMTRSLPPSTPRPLSGPGHNGIAHPGAPGSALRTTFHRLPAPLQSSIRQALAPLRRSNRVWQLQAALLERESVIRDRESVVKDREKAIREREQAVREREEAIRQRDRTIADLEAELQSARLPEPPLPLATAATAKEDTAGWPRRVDLHTAGKRELLDRLQRELDASERVAPMHNSYKRIDPYIVELDQAGHTYQLIIFHVESELWYAQQHWYDPSFMYFHDAKLIRQGDVIFDLGCNAGCTTCWYAMATGPTGHVHAFDPFPWNAIGTRYNAELNGLRNVTVHQVGVGAKNEEIELSLYDAKITSRHGPHVIKATIHPLSHYAKLKPNVLKIDIEGAEYELSQTDFYEFKQLRLCFLELHTWFIEERGLKSETCLANFMRHGFELRRQPNDPNIYDGSPAATTHGGYFMTRSLPPSRPRNQLAPQEAISNDAL